MLPNEVILALALVDLPISLDTTDSPPPKDGSGASDQVAGLPPRSIGREGTL